MHILAETDSEITLLIKLDTSELLVGAAGRHCDSRGLEVYSTDAETNTKNGEDLGECIGRVALVSAESLFNSLYHSLDDGHMLTGTCCINNNSEMLETRAQGRYSTLPISSNL
jgi:hypothetical protein